MATLTTNESSFTVLAPSNKIKPVYILDEDDDDDGYNNHGPVGMDMNPFSKNDVATRTNPTSSSQSILSAVAAVTNPSTLSTSSSSCLTTGRQSFQECSDLQRELLTLQATLFQGMTQTVVATQEQVLQLQQEIRQLQSALAKTRTLLLEEQEKNQVSMGYFQHYPPRPALRPDYPPHHQEVCQQDDPCTSSRNQEEGEEKGGGGGEEGEFGAWSLGGVGSLWIFGNHTTALNLKDYHDGVAYGK